MIYHEISNFYIHSHTYYNMPKVEVRLNPLNEVFYYMKTPIYCLLCCLSIACCIHARSSPLESYDDKQLFTIFFIKFSYT